MIRLLLASTCTLLIALAASATAQAQCRMNIMAELPLVLNGNQPLIRGEINGRPMLALLDSGSSSTVVWGNVASRYGLNPVPVRGLQFTGVGGTQNAQVVTIGELKLGGSARRDFRVAVVMGTGPLGREDVAMLIGSNLLRQYDVEYDFKQGVARFLKPEGCGRQSLAYWSPEQHEVVAFKGGTDMRPGTMVDVQLNGQSIRTELDTGAYTTIVSVDGARRAGLAPGDGGVVEAGRTSGVGRRTRQSWVGTFGTFALGDESIKNARIRIANLFASSRRVETGSRIGTRDPSEPEMLLGADFFRAHRVLISQSQKRVYFTYNGGPVFQVSGPLLEDEESEPGPPAAQ